MTTRILVTAALILTALSVSSQTFQRDTVVCEPVQPTDLDDITFNLFTYDDCCATIYHNRNIQITDTAIYLSYAKDDSSCVFVKCLAPGAWTAFTSKPIQSGSYSVYKIPDIYCPSPRICPDRPILIKKSRISHSRSIFRRKAFANKQQRGQRSEAS